MKQVGIRGAVRGKVAKTTIPNTSAPCPRDKVNRVFRAPASNLLWVSDFTYVSTTARQCIAKQCHERGGGSHGPPKRTLLSMLWSRPSTIDGPSRKVDWFTIRTASVFLPVWRRRPDPHSDGPLSSLVLQGTWLWCDPHSDRLCVFPRNRRPPSWSCSEDFLAEPL